MTEEIEYKLELLEKQLRDLSSRVNSLEYANMRYSGPGFTPGTIPQPWPVSIPVTCKDKPQMGYAQ